MLLITESVCQDKPEASGDPLDECQTCGGSLHALPRTPPQNFFETPKLAHTVVEQPL